MGAQNDHSREGKRSIYARLKGLLNRVVSSDARMAVYDNVSSFSQEQPILASFIFVQILLSFIPVAIFASFAIGVILFTAIAAICFTLFWISVALLLLVPVLLVTISLAIGVWIWAVVTFLVSRWMYNMSPMSRGTTEDQMTNGRQVGVSKTGEGYNAKGFPTSL